MFAAVEGWVGVQKAHMSTEPLDLLKQAIERNSGAVVSLPSAGMLRHQKTRFLGESPEFFWLELEPEMRGLAQELIQTQMPVGVSFRAGVTKGVFATQILEMNLQFPLNQDQSVMAIALKHPTEVRSAQRRTDYRVRVTEVSELSVRVWRMPPRVPIHEKPSSKCEVQAVLHDLSIGGVGVVFHGSAEEPPKIDPEDRLRIELLGPGRQAILEGAVVYPIPMPKDPSIRAGLKFSGSDGNMACRQALAVVTRMVGELQREELRRYRMGLATPPPDGP